MAPKAEKKPAQPAKKAVAKKSAAGRKKGSKKAVESYKIYIYKVGSTFIIVAALVLNFNGTHNLMCPLFISRVNCRC